MARPQKIGLDYFSLDVNLDDKVELMEAECGLAGFAVLIKLWQKIYSEGYYIDWQEDHSILFSRKINAELTLVNSVITSCFNRGIFDKGLYEKYKILTSKGIQKRYLLTYKQLKRSYIPMDERYLLINSELTSVITELTSINSEISTQKKVKEKKVKEKKEEESILNKTTTKDSGRCSNLSEDNGLDKNEELSKIALAFQNNGFGSINITVKEVLLELLDSYSTEWILEAMKIAVESNKRSLRYVKGILENWNKNGGMNLPADKNNTESKTVQAKKTKFHNFEGRTDKYTAEQLEDVAERKRREHLEKLRKQSEAL